MKSLSSLGLALSLVFGCLFLALAAEVYYLLWWKKRITNGELEDGYSYSSTGTAKEFFYTFCWKKPPTFRLNSSHNLCSSHEVLVHQPQPHHHLQPFSEDDSVEADLLRLQNYSGPPRFLFTIKEETKEDLESEDGNGRSSKGDRSRKGSRGRSLSDLFHLVETPYLTPIASPPYYTPPLTPVKASRGFNSFFGSASEAEFNWFLSSPPPMFKFPRDAADDDDRLCKRKLGEEIDQEFEVPSTSTFVKDEDHGSFITLIVNNKVQEELQYPSNTWQVLPLASSPPRPPPLKLNPTTS